MACLAPAPLPLPPFQLPSPYLIRPTPPRSSSPPYLVLPTPPRSSSPPSPSPSPPPPPHPSRSTSLSPEARPFQPRVEWKRPDDVDDIKLNFDGSVYNDGSGRASIGGVIRDCTGSVVAAFAERTEHTKSVGIVEARALIRGLQLALRLRHRFPGKLVVEGDDMVLVKLLNRDDQYTRIPQAMEDEIRMLLRCFPACEVKHIFREGNQVADALCRQAYHRPGLWEGCLPLAAWEKARDDASGVKHERIRKGKV